MMYDMKYDERNRGYSRIRENCFKRKRKEKERK